MKSLWVLWVLCGLGISAHALDRNAFTFTHYKLDIHLEPEQKRLAARGTITLRNDSDVPQKNLSLQISSSLTWRSIRIDQKQVEFSTQSYTSDIDHTGALSEAVVNLPDAIPSKGAVNIVVGYEGVIPLDATRLTRVGMPEDAARRTDWDRIGAEFTAVRGIGYVTWYPIATEAANLSDADSLFEIIGRWKARHAESLMEFSLDSSLKLPVMLTEGPADEVPTFVTADFKTLEARDSSVIYYLPGSDQAAQAYAQFLSKLDRPAYAPNGGGLKIVQLPEPGGAPFISGAILYTSLGPLTLDARLNAIYALSRQGLNSRRMWVREGLAHYAQLLSIEQSGGRKEVVSYLDERLPLLVHAEKDSASANRAITQSLINTSDDPATEIKAMWVWLMLRDMCGETFIAQIMADYKSAEDKEPSYMQHLAEAACKKDLEWFFDDWVYRDKGLPDFRVVSVYPRRNLKEGYLTTVTVENLGNASAEVPVTIRDSGGDFTERLLVKGKSQASVRFPTHGVPDQATVNDGSVPESDGSNNVFKIEPAAVDNH